ncbi:MAG: hypothetical protein EB107_11480 [Proteobacteria bacterium]|nr:hypothetical protein [Pseudomonadota bacterium]
MTFATSAETTTTRPGAPAATWTAPGIIDDAPMVFPAVQDGVLLNGIFVEAQAGDLETRLAASGAPPKGSGNAGRDPLRPLRGRGIGAGVSVLPAIGPKQSDQSRYLVRVRHVRSIDGHASRTPAPNATVRAMYITGSRTKSRATEARPDPASPR